MAGWRAALMGVVALTVMALGISDISSGHTLMGWYETVGAFIFGVTVLVIRYRGSRSGREPADQHGTR